MLKRGGDVSDKQEVLGEHILQFGKYKGKSFKWLLENDVSYALYLSDKVEEEEQAGQFNPEGPCKDSLISFLEYSRSFKEIEDLKQYLSQRPDPVAVLTEDDTTVGFGSRTQDTWRNILCSRQQNVQFAAVSFKTAAKTADQKHSSVALTISFHCKTTSSFHYCL